MTDFQIEYNPYLVKTTFKKNGVLLRAKSKLMSKSETRIQSILEPIEASNWAGLLPEIVRECNDDKINLSFTGRRIDFEDIQYCVEHYSGNASFELSLNEIKNDADIIDDLDKIINEIKKKGLKEFNEKKADGKSIFDAYEEAKNGIFEVSVIATMSSGKSTLINAILNTELLPSENKACTATVARIYDIDGADHFEAECYAADKNTIVYPKQIVDLEKLKTINSDEKVHYINIEGDIPGINSDKIRLCLKDTPGPNNSRDENHGLLTSKIIKQTNAIVLYVMNATQFGINDDKQLLCNISNEMKRAGKESRDRFIFVINKCDQLDEEKGEPVEDLLNEVRKYLEGVDITQPILIPTSARLALLIRKDRGGEKLTRMERRELGDVDAFVKEPLLHFEKFATLTPTVRHKLAQSVEEYHKDEETWDLEAAVHTGVPAVEEVIREYIDKYAYPIKIHDAVDDIIKILEEMNMKNKFQELVASDKDKLQTVQTQIKESQNRYDESKNIYSQFKKVISKLTFDQSSKRSREKQVDMKVRNLLAPFDGMNSIPKEEAEEMISTLQANLVEYQSFCQNTVNSEIDQNIFTKCTGMLEEYERAVSSVLDTIDISGFDFSKTAIIRDIKINDIDKLVTENQFDHTHQETRWKDNPERTGFLGKFKFWKPKKVKHTVDVKDGVNVNLQNVAGTIITQYATQLKNSINDMYKQAADQTEEYKRVFNKNIDNLDNAISDLLIELNNTTGKMEVIERNVEQNTELFNWVSEIDRRLKNLISA